MIKFKLWLSIEPSIEGDNREFVDLVDPIAVSVVDIYNLEEELSELGYDQDIIDRVMSEAHRFSEKPEPWEMH